MNRPNLLQSSAARLPAFLMVLSLLLVACGGLEGDPTGGDGGKQDEHVDEEHDPEAPSNVDVLTEYAGTYTVLRAATGQPPYCTSCFDGNREHERGTITIHTSGAIDFDTGISFKAGDIIAIYDRKMVGHDRRIAVNYGQSDSEERIRVYLDEALEVVEIIHDDGDGTTTRALVKD